MHAHIHDFLAEQNVYLALYIDLYTYIFIYLYISINIYLYVYLYIYLRTLFSYFFLYLVMYSETTVYYHNLSISPSICVYLSIYLSITLFIYLSIWLHGRIRGKDFKIYPIISIARIIHPDFDFFLNPPILAVFGDIHSRFVRWNRPLFSEKLKENNQKITYVG